MADTTEEIGTETTTGTGTGTDTGTDATNTGTDTGETSTDTGATDTGSDTTNTSTGTEETTTGSETGTDTDAGSETTGAKTSTDSTEEEGSSTEDTDTDTTSTETLKNFNLNEALNDSVVAIKDASGNIVYGYYFRYENGVYKCEVNGKTLTFDNKGKGLTSEGGYQLYIVDSSIKTATGSSGTRADGTTVEISLLNARETFAAYVMQGMLTSVERPLSLTDALIKQYAKMSFKIATEMMNEAAEYRSTGSSSSGTEEEVVTE